MHFQRTSLIIATWGILFEPATARPWGWGGWGSGQGGQPDFSSGIIGNIVHQFEQFMPCPMQQASLPQAPTPLPPPSAGLQLSHVAIGRGTQNYSCPAGVDPSSAPVALGAVASLFNVSCMAGTAPQFVSTMPSIALRFPVPSSNDQLAPANLFLSGHHYFTDATTPFFNMDTADSEYGCVAAAKANASPAPCPEDVPWLKLQAKPGVWQFSEVYRVNTVGGVAPATCQGQPETIEVQYAAEYWFYA